MKSLSKILKARAVTIDSDNIVNIETQATSPNQAAVAPAEPVRAEESPEEKARKVIKKAQTEAEELLDKARRDAEKLVSDAKKKAEGESKKILEQSREAGYQEGFAQAEQEGNAIKAAAQALHDAAVKEQDEMRRALEPDMVSLILDIVSKLLGDTMQINPKAIINLIKQGLAGATITGDVYIHVSQYDFEQVTENKDELLALADGTVKMEIIRDLSLSQSDCVIETPFGNIDCSLGQQFEALRKNLLYILEHK